MNKQMTDIMQRRGELLARIAAQREQVAEFGERWKTPLALADQGLAGVRFMCSQPILVASVAALFVARRRGVIGLLKLGWRVWKGYHYLASFSEKLFVRR